MVFQRIPAKMVALYYEQTGWMLTEIPLLRINGTDFVSAREFFNKMNLKSMRHASKEDERRCSTN